MVIEGQLDCFSETGTEGIYWSLLENGKSGYDGLHILKNNQKIIIYNNDDSILWEGVIKLEYSSSIQSNGFGFRKQAINNLWVNGIQENIYPDIWLSMFVNKLKAKLFI